MSIRYIYLRQPYGNRGNRKEPIGCIAYRNIEPNIFFYGYYITEPDTDLTKKSGITIPPFLDLSEDGKTVLLKGGKTLSWKQASRHLAKTRLMMVHRGIKRKHSRGEYGRVDVQGKGLNDKVRYMLTHFYKNNQLDDRAKQSMSDLIGHLSIAVMSPRNKFAANSFLDEDFTMRPIPDRIYDPAREAA